jgi:hypothetical protein
VRRDIAAGCELVLLNKFGKLEAAGEGLAGAFKAALDARIPLVTSVSPAFADAWKRFAGRPFVTLPADRSRSTRGGRPLGRPHRRLCSSTVADSNAGDNIGRGGRTAQRKPQSFFHARGAPRAGRFLAESSSRSSFLFVRDFFREPVPTFRDHARSPLTRVR